MLKKIPVAQVRVGMHVHALEGAWLSHPFWKTRFVLDDPLDLRRLRASGVPECWIDTRLGLDVASDESPAPASAAAPAAAATAAATPVPAAPAVPVAGPTRSLQAELREAAAICQRGREKVLAMFAEARMGRTLDVEGCLPLVEDIARSMQRNAGALVSLARLKTADGYSYMHSVAVCVLMVALARQLGHDEDRCRAAGLAGLVHDVGKALMPTDVLNKAGKLTADEWTVMRSHPERGHALLAEAPGASPEALDVALHHHERIDGTGYPHRLGGDAISEVARMGAICDVYDAVTSHRPYKAGWDPAETIAKMASWKGHLDPALFGAFVHSLGIYPTGSVVRLESGRLAVVLEQNPGALRSPVVNAFFSTKSQLPVEPQRLDLARPGCHDRIVAREPGAAAEFHKLDELWVEPELLRRLRR
jgi:HD-GYP domain-containing protein (c-di-GMP phosphodiesterase class II)